MATLLGTTILAQVALRVGNRQEPVELRILSACLVLSFAPSLAAAQSLAADVSLSNASLDYQI